jgi:hypothetical protein
MSTAHSNGSKSTKPSDRSRNGKHTPRPEVSAALDATDTPPVLDVTAAAPKPKAKKEANRIPAPPTPAQIVAVQTACYERIIERDRSTTATLTETAIADGKDLQTAVDAFKPALSQTLWPKQRTTVLNRAGIYFEETRHKTFDAPKMLRLYHMHRLVSDEARAIIDDPADPVDVSTWHALATLFIGYDKPSDVHTVKFDLAAELGDLIADVAAQGYTMAKAEAFGQEVIDRAANVDPNSKEAKDKRATDRAKRNAALANAFTGLVKKTNDLNATPAEIVAHLRANGLIGDDAADNVFDAASLDAHGAAALAKTLMKEENGAAISVIYRALTSYVTNPPVAKRSAPAARPVLNGSGTDNPNPIPNTRRAAARLTRINPKKKRA